MTLEMLIEIQSDYATKASAACVLWGDATTRLKRERHMDESTVAGLIKTRDFSVREYRRCSNIAIAARDLIADVRRAAGLPTEGAGNVISKQ